MTMTVPSDSSKFPPGVERLRSLGAGAAVIGHPANAVAMLANSLAEKGEEVPAGSFIMTGALTAAQAVKPGDSVTVSYQGLGSISARVV